MRMETQWRIGMNGRTGLDYNVLFRFMDRMGLSDEEYDYMLNDVRVLERESLNTMHAT